MATTRETGKVLQQGEEFLSYLKRQPYVSGSQGSQTKKKPKKKN